MDQGGDRWHHLTEPHPVAPSSVAAVFQRFPNIPINFYKCSTSDSWLETDQVVQICVYNSEHSSWSDQDEFAVVIKQSIKGHFDKRGISSEVSAGNSMIRLDKLSRSQLKLLLQTVGETGNMYSLRIFFKWSLWTFYKISQWYNMYR